MFIFRTPTAFRRLPVKSPLWRFCGEYVPVSLLVSGTTVTEVQSPTTDQINAADAALLGGHKYEIDNQLAEILLDAGYGDGLEVPGGGAPGTYFGGYGDSY